MSVGSLVVYFENLKSMDAKRTNLTRKGSSKSTQERNANKMKRFITDITEIRRPTSKNKIVTDEIPEKSKTLPKNFKKKSETNKKSNDTFKISTTSNKKDCSKTSGSAVKAKDCQTSVNTESLHQKFQNLSEQTVEIAKKVERFGENLKQKRLQSEQTNKHSNLPKSESVEEAVELSHHSSYHKIKDEDEGESSDDMFGYNTFEENEDDNYVIETYNKEGHELVITTLVITRRTIQQNGVDETIKTLMQDSDYVFHKSEYDDNNDYESNIYENVPNEENKEQNFSKHSLLEDSSMPSPLLCNNYFENDTQYSTEDDVFYDEISPEFYTPKNTNYHNNEEEENIFYHNLSNFSICDETINGQHDEVLGQAANLQKRNRIQFIIEELRKTEELYISGLRMVVENYIPFLLSNTPQDLIGRTAYLFGNIEEIYKNSGNFLELMKASGDDVDSLAQVFIDSATEFELYPLYSKNKPTADLHLKEFDQVVKERQIQLQDKLGLASYLLTPIQRLGKYVLLLEQIQKELRKADKPVEKIGAAIDMVRNVMRKGNDFIAIDSIKNSEIDLTNKGSFIMRAPFNIFKPRKFISMVFLFENIVVFTEKTSKNLEHFKYYDSIQMSDLSLGKFEEKPNIFHLTNYTKSKKAHPDATFVLEAETPKIKNEWTDAIEKKLWSQLQKAKEQQKRQNFADKKHSPKTSTSSNTDVTLRTTKKYRTASKSKSKFYYDQIS